MADIFDVVADPTRRDLLERLRALTRDSAGRAEISVGQLVAATGISQPTVSKHLKTLRDHGLVQVREEGQHRFYRLDAAPLDPVRDWVDGFVPSAGSDADSLLRERAEWAGAELGDRVGRLAAETAHTARAAWERIPVVGRR